MATSRDLSRDKKNLRETLENIKTPCLFINKYEIWCSAFLITNLLSFGCPKPSLHHLQVFFSFFNDRRLMLCRLSDKTWTRGWCSELFILCFSLKMIVLKFQTITTMNPWRADIHFFSRCSLCLQSTVTNSFNFAKLLLKSNWSIFYPICKKQCISNCVHHTVKKLYVKVFQSN